MPLQATSGAASYDAFGGGVPVEPVYIEQIFQTWLYTGNGSTQTITNGIDLAGEGGLVWWKNRTNATGHGLIDTTRGIDYYLSSNTTDAQDGPVSYISSVSSTGYSIGAGTQFVNQSANNYTSWTFRKQPKFFDVVTYTGNSVNGRQISHSLGSTPGCIIVKNITNSADWCVWHRSLTSSQELLLNTTDSAYNYGAFESADATTFTVNDSGYTNQTGSTYVAYLFAHDAGGFGLTGTDNVISCGSFTTDGSGNATVNLGYEPQWIMYKSASTAGGAWQIFDSMRGLTMGADNTLAANSSGAEVTGTDWLTPSATGFSTVGSSFYTSATYIYIAIRRGPMKVPTDGTSVFVPVAATNSGGSANTITTNFPTDLAVIQRTDGYFAEWFDRLRGDSQATYIRLRSANTSAEATGSFGLGFDNNTGYVDNYSWRNIGGGPSAYWNFRRAPSFFDEVCYTGTGVARTLNHNLSAVPELMIVKSRSLAQDGAVYTASGGTGFYLRLFSASGDSGNTATAFWNSTTPTSSVFSVGTANNVNGSGQTYVAYLFATCAGVSKVGSYTGTGATQTISCGFTGGARFVLIKKSTSTAPDKGWYVWDTARGMVSGTDPYLLLNTTAAEVNADNIYTTTGGFQIVSTDSGINASGVSYIFLAIA